MAKKEEVKETDTSNEEVTEEVKTTEPVFASIKDDIVTKLKAKFDCGDGSRMDVIINDIIENYLACDDAINDIMIISKEISTASIGMAKAFSIAQNASERFAHTFQPAQMMEIPQSSIQNRPISTPIIGGNSAIKKAKIISRKPFNPSESSVAPSTKAVVSPRPQTVRIGMGSPQLAPTPATKAGAKAALSENSKTPTTPVVNQLEVGGLNSLDPIAQQQLKDMRSGIGQTIAHPSGCIGPDMPREVLVKHNM